MTEMTAFERQLSSEIAGLMGPVRPVDDAALFAAITATSSPKWRVQSVFSAAKFVVAAAIVALFSGFLLAGVLTQSGEEQTPSVGASASTRAEPTDGPGSFSPAGSMNEAREGHTATLLNDGRILIVGGSRDPNDYPVGSAEIWDPATESFEPAGSLLESGRHTATLLEDGRVLIIGARNEATVAPVEIWDPATRSFERAGAVGALHHRSATRLRDGRVLILGQLGSNPPEAFVWDPATETVTRVDRPPALGPYYTATLLADGRVLAVGGGDTFSALTWDPVAESFESAGAGWEVRREHAASLLADGRVIVTGGRDRTGGGDDILASAQLWDPATESFDATGSLGEPRDNHTATLLSDGRVLVVGGGYDDALGSAEVWDPTTSSFEPAAPLAEGRRHHTATRLTDGRVLVIGGRGENGTLASAEIWEPGEATSLANEAVPTTPKLPTTPPIELPAEITEGIESGTLETPLGPARWVHLGGDDATLPPPAYPVPMPTTGYLALDHEAEELWMSPDLITWSSEPAPVEAPYGGLTVAGDSAWLIGSGPASLWRSPDTHEWSEVDLEALMPPEPAGPWLLDLGAPITFGDTTVVPFSHSPDPLLVHLAMAGTRDDRVRALCCRGAEGGLYRLSDDKFEHFRTVRFEVAAGGLRVIDADGMEMAFLDGVELGFIELLAFSDGWVRVPGLAMVEQGGLVPVELPDDIRGQPDTAFVVDAAGFAAYGLGSDGLVHVHRSQDGRDWRKADIIGDDPGEPTEIVGVGRFGWQGPMFIESEPHITEWTSSDGVIWESRHKPDQFGGEPFASGWIEMQLAFETHPWPGWEMEVNTLWYVPAVGEPVAIDVSALGLADPDGTSGMAVPVSSNTVLLGGGDHGTGPRDLLIITFDELPA